MAAVAVVSARPRKRIESIPETGRIDEDYAISLLSNALGDQVVYSADTCAFMVGNDTLMWGLVLNVLQAGYPEYIVSFNNVSLDVVLLSREDLARFKKDNTVSVYFKDGIISVQRGIYTMLYREYIRA